MNKPGRNLYLLAAVAVVAGCAPMERRNEHFAQTWPAATIQRVRQAGLSLHLLRELVDVDTDREWRAFLAEQNRDGIRA